MTLKATREKVTERIVVNEELGEVSYNKCDRYGTPGSTTSATVMEPQARLSGYSPSTHHRAVLNSFSAM